MKKFPLLIITIILSVVFLRLGMNYFERYGIYDDQVALDSEVNDSALAVAIMVKNYLPALEDADFAASHIVSVIKGGESLTSLYDLNKRVWRISAEDIDNGNSQYYKDKLLWERERMGLDEEFANLDKASLLHRIVLDDRCDGKIVVEVQHDEKPSPNVVVRLYEHYLGPEGEVLNRICAHALTDEDGYVEFLGLPEASSYSVLPIHNGYEYGSSQGSVGGTLAEVGDDGCIECHFTGHEHKVRVFDNVTLKNIKSDHLIIVRPLNSFFGTMLLYVVLFFAAWWFLAFVYMRRNPDSHTSLISLMASLTGICLVMMFSMNDPMNDKLIGVDMTHGIVAGVLVMILFQMVDFRAFYQDRCRLPFDIPAACISWILKPFGTKISAFLDRLPKGWGYMFIAVFFTILLFTPLGASVGGMKVNLNIGILFQPSEIAKYLIVIFMSAFFCVNAETIVKFSQKGNVDLFGLKLRMLSVIILGLGLLMGLYLLLGDMGPSMVLAFTFIIMYSVIKSKTQNIWSSDLAMLVYGIASFLLMLYIGGVLSCMWLFCLLWFILWILLAKLRQQFFESAFVFNLIIAAFVFGSSILGVIPGLDSVAERLDSRNEMCTNTWGVLPLDGNQADPGENTQVAEGLWGLASGGLFGQGVGEGSPNVIPAFHTDMILTSIGEEFGLLGLVLVIVLIAMLLRQTILHGYSSCNPFTFYLCLGIAVVTGVQFVIIALGSTGIIPLTGVTVPFFSFGKVSMILNLAAFGIVLSISKLRHDNADEDVAQLRRSEMERYAYPIAVLSLVFCIIALFVIGVFTNYTLINRDQTLMRPVYVNNINGMPVVNYNPRIALVSEKMPMGNIYDRNGILLAASEKDMILKNRSKYISYGVEADGFDAHMKARLKRYYPFGNHLFFMVGDFNSRLFFTSKDRRGYLAEARHLSFLRGYDDRMVDDNGRLVTVDLESDEFRPGKYFNNDSMLVVRGVQLRDYNVLLPALKSGNQIGTEPGDIRLTIDARLQTAIQNGLTNFVQDDSHKYFWVNPQTGARKSRKFKDTDQLRISIVVLDAKNGDLLSSAMYPLPDQNLLLSMSESELLQYADISRDEEWTAYSDMDLGLLFPSQPGSTAKVMSSMAALICEELPLSKLKELTYFNSSQEKVGYEYAINLDKDITMYDALLKSSNNYFINLVNDNDLYDELAQIYSLTGARLMYELPYSMFYDPEYDNNMDHVMKEVSKYAVSTYEKYVDKVSSGAKREPLKKHAAWQLAWGQGVLAASPLTMARVASIAAGNGYLPVTRYLADDQKISLTLEGMSKDDLSYLRYCMAAEAKGHNFDATVYGKTGTAQRPVGKNINEQDGWYIGFCDGIMGPVAFAVRLERGPGSSQAVRVTDEVLLPALKQMGYIN